MTIEPLNLPNMPVSPMYIGDDRVMTIEWQEFFRGLFSRSGGVVSPPINEIDLSGLAELYSTPIDFAKKINDLERLIMGTPSLSINTLSLSDFEDLIYYRGGH